MDEFVSAVGCGLLTNWPEHRDTQGERNDYGEGDVEVLAHATRVTAPGAERKWKLSFEGFAVKWKEAPNQGVGGSDKG